MSPTDRPRPLLRWAPPLLLVLAAGLWAAAALERWWPACRPGQLASQGCVLLQDHRYDYVAPSAPWEPVGRAAEYAGAGHLLLAAALVCLAVGRARWVALMAGVPAAATAGVGVAALTSGAVGRPVGQGVGVVALLVWALAGPPLVVAVCAARRRRGAQAVSGWVTGALLALATPVPDYLLTPSFGEIPYDTPVWSGVVGAVALLLAAGSSAVAAGWSGPRKGDGEGRVAGTAAEGHAAAV